MVRLLREAGAVIVGKANLTEFANILALDMPLGLLVAGQRLYCPVDEASVVEWLAVGL